MDSQPKQVDDTSTTHQHRSHRLVASQKIIKNFSEDVKLLWCGGSMMSTHVFDSPPSTLTFLRDFVSTSRPCIIRHAMAAEDGSDLLLSFDDLVRLAPDSEIIVDVTPDGHGDCVRKVVSQDCEQKLLFVKPEQRTMTLLDFQTNLRASKIDHMREIETSRHGNDDEDDTRSIFEHPSIPLISSKSINFNVTANGNLNMPDSSVYYYSRQNDCWRTELSFLSAQYKLPERVACIDEAFGTGPPDAINLWIGDERAVSSMHKDHYENLFYVLSGEKIFTLCPPADAPFLQQEEWTTGTFYQRFDGNWCVTLDEEDITSSPSTVRWMQTDVHTLLEKDDAVNSTDLLLQRSPLLSYVHPFQVKVSAGEMLYLPSLWFHRVTQSSETVAINYWYDMKFDSPLWCYFNLLQEMRLEPTQEDA